MNCLFCHAPIEEYIYRRGLDRVITRFECPLDGILVRIVEVLPERSN